MKDSTGTSTNDTAADPEKLAARPDATETKSAFSPRADGDSNNVGTDTSADVTGEEDNRASSIDMSDADPDVLATMVGDKDVAVLQGLGGTNGLLDKLNVTSEMGLVSGVTVSAAGDPAVSEEPTSEMAKNTELAKVLAAEQGDTNVTWLTEFNNDCRL
ncbi:hypothetical protein H4R20_006496, partial [Coemansia guatemalensis]